MTYNKGHKGSVFKRFSHNIYYLRNNSDGSFQGKQDRLNRSFRKFCVITGDILGAISIFAIGYVWLLVAGVLS